MTREARQRATTAPSPQNCVGEFRHLIHRLPVGPRDATFLAATFLTADFLAGGFLAVLAVDFLAVDFLVVVVLADAFLGVVFAAVDFLAVDAVAGNFLGSVPSELVFSPSRAGSILEAPAPEANRLSCPSLHRTRYWSRSSPPITSMISPPGAARRLAQKLRPGRCPGHLGNCW
jgi:hypothetical protein